MGLGSERRTVRGVSLARSVLPWLVAIALTWIGFGSVMPPTAAPLDAPETAFSAERAIEHVAVIAAEPRPMGTTANAAVRDYIIAELRTLGIEPERHEATVPDYFEQDGSVSIVNVVARIPGKANTKAVALMAHYDTVPTTPGANDNAAAVAAMLETARAFRSGPPANNDLVLLFTDAEEPAPRFGASSLIKATSLAEDIGLVVNFEAIGDSGASILVETSGSEGWIVKQFAAAVSRPVAFSFLTEIVELLGDIGTDFDPFRNAGVPGLHFAYLRGSPIYHTSADDIASVGMGSLQHHGSHGLSIARHFGDLDLADEQGPEPSVYFTLYPLFVRYPSGWAVPLAVLTALVFGGAAQRLLRQRIITPAAVARGAGGTALGAIAAAIVGTVLWMIIVSIRSMPAVSESFLYLSAALAAGAVTGLKTTARTRLENQTSFAAGVVFLWVLLALATGFGLPGVSYLFLWPALAACLALIANSVQRNVAPVIRLILIAGPALLLFTPAIEILFQMAQPRPGNLDSQIPTVVFAPLLLAHLVIALVWVGWPRPTIGEQVVAETLPDVTSAVAAP